MFAKFAQVSLAKFSPVKVANTRLDDEFLICYFNSFRMVKFIKFSGNNDP